MWQIRARTKGSVKNVPQEDSSIPKKKVSLAELKVNPETSWVTDRESVLQELVKYALLLTLSTALEMHQYEKAKTAEGDSHTGYLGRNLRTWFVSCSTLEVSVVSMKNKMFSEIFEELDQTYMTLGAHLIEYVSVLFKCLKVWLEPGYDYVPMSLKTVTERIDNLQEIFKNSQH